MLRRGGYSKDFKHRFGVYSNNPSSSEGKKRIWIQAVSVGELRAIEELVRALHAMGDTWIAVTTTTSTAYKILEKDFAEITHFRAYFPLDFLPISARVWKQIEPDLAILMESELWPEHMHQANKRGVPVLLINARLSDRSFRRYHKMRSLAGFVWRNLDRILACSQLDADRYVNLGVEPSKIKISGSLKLDKDVKPRLGLNEIEALKAEMGFPSNARVILGSSTWPGEETMLCRIFEDLQGRFDDLKLLIVPRHAERTAELRAEFLSSGLTHHFRSDAPRAQQGTDIYVADTTGELPVLSQVAELAFIGKSMPPHTEAQSMIECAILGIPALIGPGYSNFRAIVAGLKEAKLIREVETEQALQEAIAECLSDTKSAEPFRARAAAWHRSNLGALDNTLEAILDCLK